MQISGEIIRLKLESRDYSILCYTADDICRPLNCDPLEFPVPHLANSKREYDSLLDSVVSYRLGSWEMIGEVWERSKGDHRECP